VSLLQIHSAAIGPPYLLMQYRWVAVRRKISPSANAGVLSV
jgi:hypothetical protein